ncbi:LptF/LptG family permease [Mailhella sp.]|uniref:LptF/LptG family permease n=1 Tax=Mailhella sp. TaxID=1981029 RepID=UPI003AB89812
MSLLFRYVFMRHARLLLLIMGLGVGIYLLTDIVERVDVFMEAGSSVGLVLQYFGIRLPSIIAQILPAVFLLATVVTLCLMGHSRELTALHAGGISFATVACILVMCGVFWGGVQFCCSQFLAVQGERYAQQIWQEEVKKKDLSERTINDVWFMENGWTVSVTKLRADGEGTGFSAFHVKDGGSDVDVIVRAPRVKGSESGWVLAQAVRLYPDTYKREELARLELPLHQDPELFFSTESNNLQQLPLWQLGDAIRQLGEAGSNVDGLRTVWHGKISYAASLVVMALLGAAIVSRFSNVYIAVAVSMAGTFIMYSLTMFGESLGQRGVLPPFMAAWGPDALLLLIAVLRLYVVSVRR